MPADKGEPRRAGAPRTAADRPVVVIATPVDLAAVAAESPLRPWGEMDVGSLTTPAPSDPAGCEKWRRGMEDRCNRLRHKMIVRLLTVSLLDPAADALAPAVSEWRRIAEQMEVNDERMEGVAFVTVLIAREGDFTGRHRESLAQLLAAPRGDGEAWPHRIFLMSRDLELGTTENLHAIHVWPLLTARLLEHLAWQRGAGAEGPSPVPGIYAWRVVQFGFAVESETVKSAADGIQRKIQEHLSREAPAPDPASFAPPGERPLVDAGMEPEPPADNAGEWWADPAVLKNRTWEPRPAAVQHYAASVQSGIACETRLDLFSLTPPRDDHPLAQRTSESSLAPDIRLSRHIRTVLGATPFPPALPSPENVAPDLHPALERLGEFSVLQQDLNASERLRDASLTELETARLHFVSLRERLIVGAALAGALAFFAFAAVFLLHSAASFPAASRGGWLGRAAIAALVAVCGVAAGVFAGFRLQDARGRRAALRAKNRVIDAQKARARSLHAACALVRVSAGTRRQHWRAEFRQAMRRRLQRLHEIVSREWIPAEESDPISDVHRDAFADDSERQRAVARDALLIPLRTHAVSLDPDNTARLEQRETEAFRQRWREMLDHWDRGDHLFLPAPPVVRFLRTFRLNLRESVRDACAAQLKRQIASRGRASHEADRLLPGAPDVIGGSFMNFASVNLPEGSRFTSVLTGSGAMLALLQREMPPGSAIRTVEVDDSALPAHAAAVLFSEARLEILPDTARTEGAKLKFRTVS